MIGEHSDYLRYSLLKYVIDLYGSDELKKEMDSLPMTTSLVCIDKLDPLFYLNNKFYNYIL